MTQSRSVRQGLASSEPVLLAQQTLDAWCAFRDAIDGVDIDALTRVKNRRARTVIAKVGDWPESRQLPEILADAHAGRLAIIDQDTIDDSVVAAHQHDSRAELLAAIDRARDSLADWIGSSGTAVQAEATLPVGSPLGTLPLLTYLHAAAFQLAIAGRDLERAGAVVPDSLLRAGLRALVDTTGALAARMSIESVFAVVTPIAGVVTVADDNGWSVDNLDGTDVPDDLPGLRGDAGLLLDIAAGRRNPVTALRGKGVRINQLHRLLKLAPIAKENPGLPGGSILRRSTPLIAALGR